MKEFLVIMSSIVLGLALYAYVASSDEGSINNEAGKVIQTHVEELSELGK